MNQSKNRAKFPSDYNSSIEEHIESGIGKVCLDIGCGDGRLAEWVAQQGYDCLAIDKHAIAPGESYRFQRVDVLDFPLERSSFDLILAIDVLQFLSKSDKYITMERCARALKENGRIIIESFTDAEDYFINAVKNGEPLLEHNTLWHTKLNCHVSFFSPLELGNWATNADLQIICYQERTYHDDHPPQGKHQHALVLLVAQRVPVKHAVGR